MLPKIGALATSARMRASGKMNAASQAVSWALVKLITTQPTMYGMLLNNRVM